MFFKEISICYMRNESRVDSSEIAKLQWAKKTAPVELERVPAIGRQVARVDSCNYHRIYRGALFQGDIAAIKSARAVIDALLKASLCLLICS